MNNFTHYQPTKINFGINELDKLGIIAKTYGNRCLLITPEPIEVLKPLFNRAKKILKDIDMEVFHYDKVMPNPYSTMVDEAVEMAYSNDVDVVIALGGGSSIDTGKIVSYYARQGNVEWKQLFENKTHNFNDAQTINKDKLPLIAVSTTSGTGSQCTQAAVITDDKTDMKTTLFNLQFFPEQCIVDPKLMETLPYSLTASTGFDAFCHLSESYLNGRLSPMVKVLTIDAIKTIVSSLPKLRNDNNIKYREELALADTIAGISLSNGGANIPHFLGEILTSVNQTINHGTSLAIIYPHFVEEYFEDDQYHEGILDLVEIFNPSLERNEVTKEKATETIVDFLEKINLNVKISNFTDKEEDINNIKEIVASGYSKRYSNKEKLLSIITKAI